MNKILVDANVIAGYYKQIEYNECDLTCNPVKLFENCGSEYKICVDEGGKIEHEWEEPVDSQWFRNHISQMFLKDDIVILSATEHREVENNLRNLGFPVNEWDVWYIRLSISILNQQELVHFVSEDMDFYDPELKGQLSGEDRLDFIKRRSGSVLSYVSDLSIEIMPVINYLR